MKLKVNSTYSCNVYARESRLQSLQCHPYLQGATNLVNVSLVHPSFRNYVKLSGYLFYTISWDNVNEEDFKSVLLKKEIIKGC